MPPGERYGTLGVATAIARFGVTGCSAMNGSTNATAAQGGASHLQAAVPGMAPGPANPGGRKLQADAARLGSADDDIPVMASDLKVIGADAAALEAYPMPQCPDAAGYWTRYLAAIKAAGYNAGSASGLGAILLAAVPFKQVPAIQPKLNEPRSPPCLPSSPSPS